MQSLQFAILFALFATSIAAPYPPLSPLPDGYGDGDSSDYSQREYIHDQTSKSDREPRAETAEPKLISQRQSGSETPVTHYILSMATGQFVAITKSGRVSANAQIGRLVAQFFVLYSLIDEQEHISLKSVKYESRGWYLTVQSNRRIRGNIPSNGNDIFEVISMSGRGPAVALKVPNRREVVEGGSGEGDLTPEIVEDCFLGFSATNGRPACYNSTDHVETHLLFLDTGL